MSVPTKNIIYNLYKLLINSSTWRSLLFLEGRTRKHQISMQLSQLWELAYTILRNSYLHIGNLYTCDLCVFESGTNENQSVFFHIPYHQNHIPLVQIAREQPQEMVKL